MRHTLFAVLTLFAATSGAEATRGPVMCTMDYRPVCALKDGRWQTFSNACMAGAAKARRIRPGACPRR